MSEISKIDQNFIVKKIDNKTVNIQISENETLMAIVGQFDQNLKELSKLTHTNVFFRGNSITCKGNQENLNVFCDALKFLVNKYILTKVIEKEDITLSVKKKYGIKRVKRKIFQSINQNTKKNCYSKI